MRIGVPVEIKNHETRVGLDPASVAELVGRGHEVLVEAGAGVAAAFADDVYRQAGAHICGREQAWAADVVVKVKEPLPEEWGLLGSNTLFTFLHLAANEPLARALIDAGTTAYSYDTVQTADGTLPILAPMSAIAGALAIVAGSHHLLSTVGGPGVLLGGAPGARAGVVVVIGAGVAGTAAAVQAKGAGADVVVLDVDEARLGRVRTQLEGISRGTVRTVVSTPETVERECVAANLIVGAVLVPGRPAPHVLTRALLDRVQPGTVVVDIAIDQGGCCEASRPTTHDDPVFQVGNATLYCVANMPGAVGATATHALTAASMAYLLPLVDGRDDPALGRGLNVAGGMLRAGAVAEAFPHLPAQVL